VLRRDAVIKMAPLLASEAEIELVKTSSRGHFRQALAALCLAGFAFVVVRTGFGKPLFACALLCGGETFVARKRYRADWRERICQASRRRGRVTSCAQQWERFGGEFGVQPASQRVPDGGTPCCTSTKQAIGDVVEWASGGAFKYGDADRMTEADTPKLRATTEHVASAVVGAEGGRREPRG
jgi:hypothetical protein